MYSLIITLSIFLSDPSGLAIGSSAPDFTATDQFGNQVNLNEKLKSGKVIVTFYRGAWCRYCMKQMQEMQDSLSYISSKNATLIAISPEHEEGIMKTAKVSKASFSLIHDDGLEIMSAYKVISPERVEEYKAHLKETGEDNQHKFLPVPATYIIDESGKVTYKYFDPNYKVRPSVKVLLENL